MWKKRDYPKSNRKLNITKNIQHKNGIGIEKVCFVYIFSSVVKVYFNSEIKLSTYVLLISQKTLKCVLQGNQAIYLSKTIWAFYLLGGQWLFISWSKFESLFYYY
jgi:hypothetical protein